MYWDTAATTPVKPEVLEAMMPYFTDKWYNPSAIYEPAREIRRDIDNARKVIAKSINANPDEIYFTSGGSESNSWVVNSDYWFFITSPIEHHSIDSSVHRGGKTLITDVNGIISYAKQPEPEYASNSIVSVIMANNEIGTIQNIKELAKYAHEQNLLFHTDAVQAYGKIPIDVKELDVDALSVSGHKIGAPKGIGFLYIKNNVKDLFVPMIYGSQERDRRGGTENVPYIMGLAKAVELIDYSKQDYFKEIYEYAVEECQDFATVNGHPTQRLYNILSLTIKEPIDGQQLIGLLHDQGEYVSAGSACNAYSPEPSHVLKAIGLSDEEASRTIRISFPDNVDKGDINRLFENIRQNVQILKMMTMMNFPI